jgi:hypothetical protein
MTGEPQLDGGGEDVCARGRRPDLGQFDENRFAVTSFGRQVLSVGGRNSRGVDDSEGIAETPVRVGEYP